MASAMSLTRPSRAVRTLSLPSGAIAPSPVKRTSSIRRAFAEAGASSFRRQNGADGAGVALILPITCRADRRSSIRTSPHKGRRAPSLKHFRLRKSVPFRYRSGGFILFRSRQESNRRALRPPNRGALRDPFRAVGLHPGLITVSSLAMLDLLPANRSLVVARLSPAH